MGGSGWAETGPYQKDLGAAFRLAQAQELAKDDHGFPGQSIRELWRDEDWQEYILTGGTGTVLDFYALIDAEADDDVAMMRPLTVDEVRSWAPNGRPTRAQWEDALPQLLTPVGRGTGRCTVLYRADEPAEIAYWGCTAD
ncbi:hypothetical protein [Streptomyces rubellomurinus]|uniref:Uncharacterized protein n=1 Tax=Streptomyces rubellomurinus (strain ATCC 31215) TaxID=359131 RepID=A0A0F2TDY8_STRR3|nr:hypothetical protein [Streptomyces rubellomurinus]KJS61379.1 hypothetical protein VM95_15340 [Streptomyces rubellomurinus]